jgi:hydrophobic/amphiphilic exporter-1 (mainly G- bacteria), HAE1 family
VLTREGVPVYLRDIADVRTPPRTSARFVRINGKPGVRMRVTKQSGENTVAVADRRAAEIERINREVPGVKLTVTNDSSRLHRAVDQRRAEHVMLGAVLVVIIIFSSCATGGRRSSSARRFRSRSSARSRCSTSAATR